MQYEMRQDIDLLIDLLNEAPIVRDRVTGQVDSLNAKRLAHWTGLSVQTVSDYRTGKYNIPIDFWRRILERFYDLRIINLLIPDTIEFEAFPKEAIQPRTAREFFREAIEAEGEHHQKQTYLCEILADGRIDKVDAFSVQAYDDAYWKHRARDAVLHRSIVHCFNQARTAEQRQP